MKLSIAFSSLIAAGLLASCATQTPEQLASVRAAGVSPALVHRLAHWGVLSPEDLIELKRRHVNDAIALRQLDRVGVDYIVSKDIIRQLRKAGISEDVMSAVTLAGQRFAEQFHQYQPSRYWAGGWYGPGGYPYAYDPYLSYGAGPYFYGGPYGGGGFYGGGGPRGGGFYGGGGPRGGGGFYGGGGPGGFGGGGRGGPRP